MSEQYNNTSLREFKQCCSPEIGGGGGWGVFNSLFGWQNSATYGSVISYNLYWLTVICAFLAMRYNETHGRWPLMPRKKTNDKVYEIETEEDGKVTPPTPTHHHKAVDLSEHPMKEERDTSTGVREVRSFSSEEETPQSA